MHRCITLAGLSLLPGLLLAQPFTVSSVHDGDTMRLNCPGERRTVAVRLERIDAPEIDQAYGIAARDFLRALCAVGSPATLIRHGRDRYGRTLGDVDCGHGSVQEKMLGHGHAWVYPTFASERTLVDLQKAAQAGRLGLWSSPKAVAPWVHRKRTAIERGAPR